MAVMEQAGLDALRRLKTTDPPQWLAPSPDFSQAARTASKHLFSCLNPYSPKSPFDQLLIDGFDAEQIDLQSKPLLSSLGREIKLFEKNPEEISKLVDVLDGEKKAPVAKKSKALEEESDGFDDELDDGFDEDDGDENEEGESEEEGSESNEEDEEEGEGVEDKFLKIKELKDYLKKDEAGEFGLKKKGDSKNKMNTEEDDEDGDEEDDDELGLFGDGDEDEEEGTDKLARYDDFFGATKKKTLKRESGLIDGSEDSATDEEGEEEQEDEEEEYEDDDDDEEPVDNKKKDNLSTHEKQLEKVRSKIEQMEKSNLEEKTWTIQGEVTAAKRPKNSALEVDLDFEHNVRPAPVITEEVTASLEEIIQKRILEGRFDDVQKAPRPTKAPRETKELDENKSKKGLAEVYEEEYVQKTDPASAPLTFSDEQKKEASVLFKKLCLKLDALSHFHFAPKPVIEDMSIQTNVPALAMEEIAPLAVSDAAMLAPEEVFAGKGDIKEEAELTQAERKRRRANKKRKFKAETIKRTANKAQKSTLSRQEFFVFVNEYRIEVQ